jgi:3-oxoacyl-[acyl-carrier-protein] synthase-3
MRRAVITGIGTHVPEKILTNEDLERMVDTSDEWIVTRTGIKERRIAGDENASDLAEKAGKRALSDAGLALRDVDLLMLTTSSPEMIFPSTACLAQAKMGLTCPAFDIMAACSGFVFGTAVADALIRAGAFRRILLVGTDAMSRLVDYSDRGTCILFGDGAGAVVLEAADDAAGGGTGAVGTADAAGASLPGGVLASALFSDGTRVDALKVPAGGSAIPVSEESVRDRLHYIKMDGKEVYKFATKAVPEAVEAALAQAGLTLDDVDFVIPHQANQRIIDAAAERLGLPHEKMVSNISRYGNTSTASIPLALEELVREGRITPGMVVVLVGFGAGLTWGASVIRWTKEGETA